MCQGSRLYLNCPKLGLASPPQKCGLAAGRVSMTTGLQVRKREKIFSQLDTDNDGMIGEADVQKHITGFLEKFVVPPKSPKAQELHEAGHLLWQELSGLDADKTQTISMEEYVGAIDNDMVERTYVSMNGIFFKVVDADNDGLITEDELVAALVRVGMEAQDVRKAFRELDEDGDGGISRTEWDRATREMLLSSDSNAPGSLLLGVN
jgi:Ca2+-binding EF-hand superfamily protein